MRIGMIRLGRMGGILAAGHEVVTYARRRETLEPFVRQGAIPATTYDELGQSIWLGYIRRHLLRSGPPASSATETPAPRARSNSCARSWASCRSPTFTPGPGLRIDRGWPVGELRDRLAGARGDVLLLDLQLSDEHGRRGLPARNRRPTAEAAS